VAGKFLEKEAAAWKAILFVALQPLSPGHFCHVLIYLFRAADASQRFPRAVEQESPFDFQRRNT